MGGSDTFFPTANEGGTSQDVEQGSGSNDTSGESDRSGDGQCDGTAGFDFIETAWELAGITGLEPGDRTLRELTWAANAKRRDEWDRMSLLLAVVHNRTNFDKNGKVTTPLDWFPQRLITSDHRKAIQKHKEASVMRMSVAEFAKGLTNGRR